MSLGDKYPKRRNEMARSITHLNFGALPYREHEVMRSEADIAPLKALGWICRIGLAEGIEKIIQEESRK